MRFARVQGRDWARRPSHFHRQVIEHRAAAAFENETIGVRATKEDAVLWSVERKEIRAPHQIGPLVVLHFKNFAIGSEKAGCRGIARQSYAKQQQRALISWILEDRIAIAR